MNDSDIEYWQAIGCPLDLAAQATGDPLIGHLSTDGYETLLAAGREHKDRVWAVEGCNGIGRHDD